MDISRIVNDEKGINIHKIPECPMPEILKQYGLWIFRGVSSAIYYQLERPRYFQFYSLAHIYEGEGVARINDREYRLVKGDCIFLKPGTVNLYWPLSGKHFREDTVNFIGSVTDQLAAAGIFRDGVFPLGQIRRLLPIIHLGSDPAEDSMIRANIELQKLLVDVYLERHEAKGEYPLFQKLLLEIKTRLEHWWTVEEMAEMCNLSDDQMRRVFLEYTGTTPKLYVDRLKIAKAAEMLAAENRSVAEIAWALGYRDPYHFSRRFKQIQGMSPVHFRATLPAFRAASP